MNGIDVSRYQGSINWKKVRKQGIRFAMCKASQGGPLSRSTLLPFEDKRFGEYVKGATRYGVYCGAYHFLTGTTIAEVEKEADYFAETVKKHGGVAFPCACDLEASRYKALTKEQNSALVLAFAERLRAAGLTPMLYTNLKFSTRYLDMDGLKGIDIWYARYRKNPSPEPKPTLDGVTMYQWTSDGSVDGIEGRVDLDVCYRDYANPSGIEPGMRVRFKPDTERYWNGGPVIPKSIRGRVFTVETDIYRGYEVIKGGEKCVLLGGIKTWTAVTGLTPCDG